MTLKLELNDWEALSVEVALVTLQERWMAKSRDGAGAPALASLQILIDKVWKAMPAPEHFFEKIYQAGEGAEVSQKEFRRQTRNRLRRMDRSWEINLLEEDLSSGLTRIKA